MITVEVCIPTRNERAIILRSIKTLSTYLDGISGVRWSIVVADSGSIDGTADLVESSALSQVRVLRADRFGKGYALKKAFESSQSDIVGFVDSDLSVGLGVIEKMIRELIGGKCHIAVGSRFHPESRVYRNIIRKSVSYVFNFLSKVFLASSIDDNQCPVKFMDKVGKALFLSCAENTWFTDVEFLCRAKIYNVSVSQLPIEWKEYHYPDRKSKTSIIRGAVEGIRAFIRIRRSFRVERKNFERSRVIVQK
jgi:glycosyltransferase involved in cell wall biosynthesis